MKKSLLFILFIAIVVSYGIYQNSNKANETVAVEDKASEAFKSKWENKATKALGFFKWRQEMLTNFETGKVETQDYYKALAAVKALNAQNNKADVLTLEWDPRGPDNQGGRVRTLLVDKDNPELIFTGSVSGGLFKSIDGSETWERVPAYNDGMNAAIMSSAQSVDGRIFIGTGEALAGGMPNGDPYNTSIAGSGIYYSSDLGDSWTSIDATNEHPLPTFSGHWSSVRMMATHPSQANILLAGNNGGLYLSTDADQTQPTFTIVPKVSGGNIPGNISDVKIVETSSSVDGWCTSSGRIYKSTTSTLSDPWQLQQTIPSAITGAARAQLAISTPDAGGNYIIYASFTDGPGCLVGLIKSEDKGTTWTQIVFAGGLDPFAQPTGGNTGCQGWYDHCLAVNPADKNKLYIGGITLYTWGPSSGGLKRADKIGSEGAGSLDPDYIHADKHGIFFCPHDTSGNTMFIAHDGGISRTLNAYSGFPDEMVYTEQNRDFITLQCYSIGSGKYGEVIAGSQDNGTMYNNYKGISKLAAVRVSGGDGVAGAEISNLDPTVAFTGVYNGRIKRSLDLSTAFSATAFVDDNIDLADCGRITCATNPNGDPCSGIPDGQSFIFPFLLMETHARKTERQTAYIYARDEIITLPGGSSLSIKDTIQPGNVIDHDNFKFQLIPGLNSEGLDLSYNLTNILMPGDTQWFDTPFDSKYFVPTLCGSKFFVCANPLQIGTQAKFNYINLSGQSLIRRMDFSADGDMLVAVTSNGRVIIMQGWDDYAPTALGDISTITHRIVNVGGNITGVNVDKNNKDRVLVTLAGFGGSSKVYIIENATSLSPTATSVQGNLPIMPTYDCVISHSDPNKFIVGTELGIYASDDAGASWQSANNGIGALMPVFSVREQWVNNFDCYLLSAGSLGGGMYTSTSLSSCEVVFGAPKDLTTIKDLNIKANDIILYPNPTKDDINIAFELSNNSNVNISLIDLTGKIVSNTSYNLSTGKQSIKIDVSHLAKSNYMVEVKAGNTKYNSKMFLKK